MPRSPKLLTRRELLRSAAKGASGLALAYLVGCGNGDEPSPDGTPTPAPSAITAVRPPRWHRLEPSTAIPAARRNHSLVGDGESTLLLFAGRNEGSVLDDLWSYDLASGDWTEVTSTQRPPARFGHNAVFAGPPDQQAVYIFGGQNGQTFFNDLWSYNPISGEWAELGPSGGPPTKRYASGGALDASGRFIVSHGFTTAGHFDDTWAYDPAQNAWTDISPLGRRPAERSLMRVVWDSINERLIMYGGQTTGVPFLGDQWEFDGGTWLQIDVKPSPGQRNLYAAAFDEEGSRIILVGGDMEDGPVSDVWFFDVLSELWRQQPAEGVGPSTRFGHDGVWLPIERSMIVFGGNDGAKDLDDLWKLSVPA